MRIQLCERVVEPDGVEIPSHEVDPSVENPPKKTGSVCHSDLELYASIFGGGFLLWCIGRDDNVIQALLTEEAGGPLVLGKENKVVEAGAANPTKPVERQLSVPCIYSHDGKDIGVADTGSLSIDHHFYGYGSVSMEGAVCCRGAIQVPGRICNPPYAISHAEFLFRKLLIVQGTKAWLSLVRLVSLMHDRNNLCDIYDEQVLLNDTLR
mmetsp:Transcript_6734/g.10504  ORF Transcript_6734/g.10504 Transcript_6734/m.10504 type:complete len:209 (-) Transcript_6734:170-796(-)